MQRNLADPDYEPTDEELQQLSRDAFAEVGAKRRVAVEKMRVRILAARAERRRATKDTR